MKLILLNGPVAAGKTTLGKALTKKLTKLGEKTFFYDLDDEVERINGNHIFESENKKTHVWLNARKNYALIANKHLSKNENVVMVGPFFQKAELNEFLKHIHINTSTFLYTLNSPLEVRLYRNKNRRWSNPEEDLKVQHTQIENLKERYGHIFDNSGEIKKSVKSLISLINSNLGSFHKEQIN